MAMLPFPTFGGPKQGGGIMDVKLAPSQMRFPTARRPAPRRTVEPDLDEKLAPLLPFLVGGIQDLIKGSPELMNDASFLESINADPTQPSFEEKSRLDAYKLYGPETKPDTFGGDDILDLLIAGSLGRGGDDYAKTAANMKTAKEQSRTNLENRRANFIATRKKPAVPEFSYANFLNKEAELNGVKGIYSGRINTKTGVGELLQPDGSYIKAGPEYIKQTGTQNIALPGKSEPAKEWDKLTEPIYAKEETAVRLNTIAGGVDDQLTAIGTEGRIVPNTVTSALGGMVDRMSIEFDNLSAAFGFEKVEDFFSNDEVNGGIKFKGSGQKVKTLREAIASGDEARINAATEAFSEVYEEMNGMSLKQALGEVVYDDLALRSQMIQMAYFAAGLAGQTGRTLSDKDLAFFMQIVGYNETSNVGVLKKNINRFMTRSIDGIDNEIQLAIQQRFNRFDFNDPYIQSGFGDFYTPPLKENPKNEYDFNYPKKLTAYAFRPMSIRRPGLGLDRWNFTESNVSTLTDVPESENDSSILINNAFEGL